MRYVWNYGTFTNTISSVYQSLIREGMLYDRIKVSLYSYQLKHPAAERIIYVGDQVLKLYKVQKML